MSIQSNTRGDEAWSLTDHDHSDVDVLRVPEHRAGTHGEEPRGMKVTRMRVSPELATKWLGYNTHNRNHRGAIITSYAEAMKNGDWRNDIDPIAFAGTLNGRGKNYPVLLNGQHRLHALVAANITLEFLVIEGLGIEDQVEMDAGVKRQLADQLRLNEVFAPTETAASLRLVYAYENDILRGRQAIGNSALLRYLESHPELPESVRPARRLYAAIGGRISVYAACHYIISQLDDPSVEEDLEEFFELLYTGESLPPGSPILAFRSQMLAMNATGGGARRRFGAGGQMQMMALFLKAWNAWRDGSTLQTLVWRGGGRNPEAFPVPA